MTDIVVVGVLCVIGLLLAQGTYSVVRHVDVRERCVATVRAIRWWMVPSAIAHVSILVVAILVLLSTIPLLKLGWWMLLGGSGNVALGQTGRSGQWWQIIGLLVPVWILFLVPLLAYAEEVRFRYGSEAESWHERWRRQTIFGLGHALVMGVPIGAGLVLIGSGLVYQTVYLKSLNRLLEHAEPIAPLPEPTRIEYPPSPTGPYDPAIWEAHHAAVKRVGERNSALLDEWREAVHEQDENRQLQVNGMRETAVTTAAALHTVTNWVVVGLLVAFLFADVL